MAAQAERSSAASNSAQSGTRPRRLRSLPARLRDDDGPEGGDDRDDCPVLPPRPAAVRSLSVALDAAASPATDPAIVAGGEARRGGRVAAHRMMRLRPPCRQWRQRAHLPLTGLPSSVSWPGATCRRGYGDARGVAASRRGCTSARCLCGPRGVAQCCWAWPAPCRRGQ